MIFDSCTRLLFARTGHSASGMRETFGIIGMPLVEAGARFLVPCRFDDEITVESEIAEWGRSSFTVRHRIMNGGELAVDGFEKRVWASADPAKPGAIKAQKIPADIIAALSSD
jgi:4-hydroxybenzoyl-CoA thioesterase